MQCPAVSSAGLSLRWLPHPQQLYGFVSNVVRPEVRSCMLYAQHDISWHVGLVSCPAHTSSFQHKMALAYLVSEKPGASLLSIDTSLQQFKGRWGCRIPIAHAPQQLQQQLQAQLLSADADPRDSRQPTPSPPPSPMFARSTTPLDPLQASLAAPGPSGADTSRVIAWFSRI